MWWVADKSIEISIDDWMRGEGGELKRSHCIDHNVYFERKSSVSCYLSFIPETFTTR